MQLDIFSTDKKSEVKNFHLQNGVLIYYPQFYKADAADQFFYILLAEIKWKQEAIKLYGKSVLYPRLTAWYGDNNRSYEFSGTNFDPNSWTDTLRKIKEDIAKAEEAHFNSVLLNLYRNGNDSVAWHTDDEPELGANPVIASVNFGAARRFLLRRIDDHSIKTEVLLEHGSLLIMKGELQHYWQHQVPKSSKVIKPRINLTFRYIHS